MDTVQQSELDNARHGTLFFLGKLEVSRVPSFDIGLVSNFVSGTSAVADLKNATVAILGQFDKGRAVISGLEAVTAGVKETLATFFDSLLDRLSFMYGETGAVIEWVGEFVSWAVSTFVGSLSDIIPGWGYVQDAADIYSGIRQAVSKAIDWFSQVFSGWGVSLLAGGPSIMAESIALHNAAGLTGGLKDIAISSCKVGLKAAGDATAGVGAIVGAVTGILQRVANLINYAIQRYLLNRCIDQARNQWDTHGEMMQNHNQFNGWFRRSCAFTPVVAALVMCSGNAAHPYRFIQLISDSDQVASQQDFDKGVKHIEKLKSLARDYVREYVDGYHLKIEANDPYVSGMLRHIFDN